jgi:hypothetical protein
MKKRRVQGFEESRGRCREQGAKRLVNGAKDSRVQGVKYSNSDEKLRCWN